MIEQISKTATHIRGLDEILEGGLPEGRTTVINGGAGSGKTILALEYLYRSARSGQPGVFVSFEEASAAILQNAAAMGFDLEEMSRNKRFKCVQADVPHEALNAGAFTIQGLLAALEAHCREIDARRLVLDGIDLLMQLYEDPNRERREFYILNEWLRQREMTAVLTVKASAYEPDKYDFLDFMADCVVRLDQRMENQVRTRRLQVVKYRGSSFLSNEHPFVISAKGMVLMPPSATIPQESKPAVAVSSGLAAFDQILGGGFRRGSSIMISGLSGSGKTTVACSFVVAAASRGERVLYVAFEQSESDLLDSMESVGLNLSELLPQGPLKLIAAYPQSLGAEEHLLNLLTTIEDFAPDHLVIDAISACHRIGKEQAVTDLLFRLMNHCRTSRITGIYLNQLEETRPLISLTGLGISSLTDTLVALQFAPVDGGMQRRLLVAKSRGRHHSLRFHPFAITDDGIQFEQPLDLEENMERDEP